jgi:hypothetical protein
MLIELLEFYYHIKIIELNYFHLNYLIFHIQSKINIIYYTMKKHIFLLINNLDELSN